MPKGQWSFEELKALWAPVSPDHQCSDPNCPNAHRVQILAESITITNLIVASEMTPELREAIASRAGA